VPRTALLGGSFDPPPPPPPQKPPRPRANIDKVVVVPYGLRPDGRGSDTPPIHRAAMTDMAFRGLQPRVEVDLTDLENQTLTPPHQLAQRHAAGGDACHVVPAELVRGGREAPIRRLWERGDALWKDGRFVVLCQPNEPLGDDLPPNHEVVSVEPFLPAAAIRGRVYHQEDVKEWVSEELLRYMERHALYRGTRPLKDTAYRIGRPRFRLFHDPQNPDSRRLARDLPAFESDDPEMIVVLGGDGTMLRAIRQHWRERLPFYGLNTGHLGFLLNDRQVRFWERDLSLYQLPLLYAEAETIDGETRTGLAFNEVWVERVSGQTAWVRLTVNGQVRIEKLVCDGVLVSTAAGSTSYARAMGATPLPFPTPVLTIAGSNVLSPMAWRPAVLPMNTEVELTTLDPSKRPLQGYMDGVPLGHVSSVRVRVSRTAAVELAFQPEHDPVAKLAKLQFPLTE
jgi:NAD+ kinase